MKRSTQQDLMARTVALIVTKSGIGNHKKVPMSQVQVEADKTWVRATKKLFECREYNAIGHLDGELDRTLETRALPSLLKRGIYLLPIPMVEDVAEILKRYRDERDRLVEEFIAVYRERMRDARQRLNKLFNQADYLTPEQIRKEFSLTWQFTSFHTPASLEQINKAIYDEERKKAEATWVEARQAIQQLLRANLADMVDHLVDKLGTKEDGKKKIFRNTAVTKLQDFLNTFDLRNVTDDAQLKQLVDRARTLIKGVDADQLRSEEALRDSVKKGFAKIQQSMSGMIIDRPKRAISLEDVA